jgi:ABC-type sugar transport system substrate-binding protein
MKNSLLRFCAAGAVLLASLLTASAADSKLIVAMLPKSKGNAYFISCKAGADKAAKELGIQLLFDGPTDSNAAKQNEIVENWITLGVDVIAVAAENKEGISTALRKAQKQGIKVLTYDADAMADARSFFVNQATPQGIGQTLMDEAARLVGAEGEFAMIVGSLTAANQREWQKYVEARLKEKFPKMKLVAVRPCDDLKDKAQSEATALLSANPKLKLIMAICSPGVPESVILWNTGDLGYLTIYAGVALAKDELKKGAKSFMAGSLGSFGIEGDNILLGKPFIFNQGNIDQFDF